MNIKPSKFKPKTASFRAEQKYDLPDFAAILNREGQEGWLLVQILNPGMGQAIWSGKTEDMLALFQREIS